MTRNIHTYYSSTKRRFPPASFIRIGVVAHALAANFGVITVV